ncbi:hypothetical protein GCM10027295_07500 [Pseudaeromonas pectinilytica]
MPAYITGIRTHKYTTEFKFKAVRWSHDPARSVKEVAQTLDIHPFMLSRWRKEYREVKFGMPPSLQESPET